MIKGRKFFIIIIVLTWIIIALSECIDQPAMMKDPRGSAYAGPGRCRQCHQAIYDSVLKE